MTSLFPLAAYAEDQDHAHTVLYLHVMRASAMSFSFVALFRLPVSLIASRLRGTSLPLNTLLARTLQTCGRGLVLGTVAGGVMTWGRMRGMEEIQWQDRTWRILENKGEVKTDWVTLGAAGAGAAGAVVAARRGAVPAGMGTAALGGAAVGAAMGVPYMVALFATGRRQV
ncbi:hypothetical protein T440DRAFT_77657 [Plenodomus tracheiphilus IPT5]|uniref:Uncharacterized protein n=1 Tax=Plenodomus tracheiphilus IPT5 TaxID=1408161 RepID=A0A6A7B6X5_9PLEO|nr:hypothetical protein T440DRAFT_77657 [Plenodomus tracheiphilus IPT5]